MHRPLRILNLEDNHLDAEMIRRTLIRSGINFDFRSAVSGEQFEYQLHDFIPDIILADNELPQFSAAEAIDYVIRNQLNIPFILVTGTLTDEHAVKMMRLGVDDFILKDRLERLASSIEIVLKNRNAERERLLARENWSRSEEKYRNFIERTTDAFYSLDRNWCYTYMNKQAGELIGRDPHEMAGKNVWEEFPEAVNSATWEAYHKAINEQRYIFNTDYYEPYDSWFENHIYPSEEGLSIFIRDVTEKMRAERATRESEETRKLIMANALDGIVCIANSGVITSWNSQAEKLFGWTEKEAIGQDLTDVIIPPAYQEFHRKGFQRALDYPDNAFRRLLETLAVKRNGEEFPIELFIVHARNERSDFFCAYIRDISERKKSEQILLLSQKRLEQAQQIAQLGHWELNFHRGTTKWSDEAYRIYGIQPGEHSFTLEQYLDFIHPEDRLEVKQRIDTAYTDLKEFSFYHRIVRKDGQVRFIHTVGKFEFGSENIPTGLYGICHDITEKKQLENELREQQRKEQLKLTSAALRVQEKERNAIGIELHDNINQILVGTKMVLSLVQKQHADSNTLLKTAIEYLDQAIVETRKISHELVTPDFSIGSLPQLLSDLGETMFRPIGIEVHIDASQYKFAELTVDQKLALYRIAQEQCTNIVKYAHATQVNITLGMNESALHMTIRDNGIGMPAEKPINGIGIKNIKGRMSVFSGKVKITTSEGNGFDLGVEMPLTAA